MKRDHVFTKAILFLFTFYSNSLFAQTAEKWADVVKWDGVTPWRNYMIYSPGFMGPNALPVPILANGSIDSVHHIALLNSFHVSRGDKTNNLRLTANYCLLKNFISADISWVLAERFNVTPQIKEQRHVYYLDYADRKAQGDLYFNINMQLLNRLRKKIHLALRTGYRYATSSSVGAARYTDAPGYHFDLSFAKPFKNDKFKIIGMAGFYIWQLNTGGQNDAILFGGGIEYADRNWKWKINCRGYSGYRHNGDRPVLVSSLIERKFRDISMIVNVSKGVNDYEFTTLEIGIKYSFIKNFDH